jgi:hypothetical protein
MAKQRKRQFIEAIREGRLNVDPGASPCEFDLVSFSGTRDLAEQCLSILSFTSWMGPPRRWTIYSDGTHEPWQKEALQRLGRFVDFHEWDHRVGQMEPSAQFVREYARHPVQHAMGKRLCAYSTHPLEAPTLFLDSDIAFYAKARDLLRAAMAERPHWFLPDVDWGCLDSRYMKEHSRAMYQMNGGFYLISPGFSWHPVIEALRSYSPDFEYFSDQTSYHIGFLSQGAFPFDPRRFIIDTSDQFSFGTPYLPGEIAMRHYTGPVRHKLWLYGWPWHTNRQARPGTAGGA